MGQRAADRAGADRVSPERIRLFAVYVSDNDITNGGFWQWLGNSYSCLYPSLLEGHRMLGLPGIADLIDDAVVQVFHRQGPASGPGHANAALDRPIGNPEVDQVVERLTLRDLTYYHPHPGMGYRSNTDELLPLRCRWIDQHPDRFFTGAPMS